MNNNFLYDMFIKEAKCAIDNRISFGSGSSSGGNSSGGVSPVSPKEVNFYDYDGTLLYAYTVAEAQALSKLPALPTQKGLTCQGWNYDLETIKSYNRAVDVGATYTTDDGTTRIYITLHDGRTSPMLGVCPNGTVTVDWGDGTEPDVLTGSSTSEVKYTPNHEYAAPGDYVIRLTVDGEMGLYTTEDKDGIGAILGNSSDYDDVSCTYINTIRKIEIGNGVSSIGECAFAACYNLSSVVISDGVSSIGNDAFGGCCGLSSVVIPDSVSSIGDSAFRGCCGLSSVVIPDSVSSIDYQAFGYCTALSSVVIPGRVSRIGDNAFIACYGLSSVVISDGVSSIGNDAFGGCGGLSSVVIPDSVSSIDYQAFSGCSGVKYYDFTKHAAVPSLGDIDVFDYNAPDCEIRVPAALYNEWVNATNWTTYASHIVAV